jgi:hypothetical protein
VQELLRQFPNELAGIPLDLLALIPPPPAGWRPGDAFDLPVEALAAALQGGAADEDAGRGMKRKAE